MVVVNEKAMKYYLLPKYKCQIRNHYHGLLTTGYGLSSLNELLTTNTLLPIPIPNQMHHVHINRPLVA